MDHTLNRFSGAMNNTREGEWLSRCFPSSGAGIGIDSGRLVFEAFHST